MQIIIPVLTTILMWFSAGDLDNGPGDGEAPDYKKAMVLDYGSTHENDCGWLIQVNDKLFRPKNLNEAFQQDSLMVKLDYEFSMSLYECDSGKLRVQEVYINWIEKVE